MYNFFKKLENLEGIDTRDDRGKIHNISVVLLGFISALLSGRDGNLSSIHRRMCNKHEELLSLLELPYSQPISRAQLPLVLKSINYSVLEHLVFEEFNKKITGSACKWFAIDGKELKGSILPGNTRGTAVVQVVRHCEHREVIAQSYFSGKKSSEVKAVRGLLRADILLKKNITLDALHLKPDTLEIINEREDFYLVGLKANQKELYEDMENVPNYTKQTHDYKTVDEHGGRVDTRVYSSYEIGNEYFDGRWKKSGFTTLIVVNRERFFKNLQKRKNKGKVEYIEREVNTDYFLSNKKATIEADAKELFEAVRGHWNVEVNNHIRDVTLKEDKLKSKLDNFHENISLVRTLVIKLLSRSLVSNFAALLDTFADSFEALVVFFEQAYKT